MMSTIRVVAIVLALLAWGGSYFIVYHMGKKIERADTTNSVLEVKKGEDEKRARLALLMLKRSKEYAKRDEVITKATGQCVDLDAPASIVDLLHN